MDVSHLRVRLGERPMVADGGTGSLIQTLGYPRALCIEHTPLTHPETVLQVRLAHIAAGSELIQAHSYGANRIKLTPSGLQAKTAAINGQAVNLAREAKEIWGKEVLSAGSIGPAELLGYPTETLEHDVVQVIAENVQEQARTLEGRGVDLFIFETFSSLVELAVTIDAVHRGPDLPIIAQIAFSEDGKTLTGVTPQDVAARLQSVGVDVR